MSEVHIEVDNQEYKIKADENGWKFYEYNGVTEKGNEKLSSPLHYGKFEQMIEGLLRRGIRISDFTDLEELRDKIECVKNDIREEVSVLSDLGELWKSEK